MIPRPKTVPAERSIDLNAAVPEWARIIFGSGITLGSIVAIGLNLLFHHLGGRGAAVAGSPGEGTVRLSDVNAMSEDEFVATFGRLFQGPEWVVRHAYAQRPFSDTQDLRIAFQEAIFGATEDEKQKLMNSYPELAKVVGDDDADPASSEHSRADQGAAGLNQLGEEDQSAFGELTKAYHDRFAFPLIVCVRDSPDRQHILDSGWARMHNSPAQERATALIQIANIANHRFDDFVADANPIHSARPMQFDLS